MEMSTSIIERLRAAAARLHEDRRGTSLTEFVITLPVFLILFEGLVILGSLQRQGVETKVKASLNMWDDAVTIQKSSIFNSWNDPSSLAHMHPAFASASAIADQIGKLGPGWSIFEGARKTALASGGHYGESDMLVDKTGLAMFSDVQPNAASTYYADASGHIDEPFAKRQVDDGFVDGQSTAFSSASGFGDLTNQLDLNFTAGVWQSQGAGIRYGSAWGQKVQTADIPMYGTVEMASGYSVLAAPRSKAVEEEPISVAITRLGAEQREEFADILGLF